MATMTNFSTNPLIGTNLENANDNFPLLTEVQGPDGRFLKVVAGSACSAGDFCAVLSSGTAYPAVATTVAQAARFGWPQVAIASGSTGWVQETGTCNMNVLASCNSGVALYTSDTAGALDDATLSTSQYRVSGVMIVATNSGSASIVAGVSASYPTVVLPRA